MNGIGYSSPVNNSMELYRDSECIFNSQSHWLYPLFELEEFLKENPIEPDSLYLKDKIAGRAAAALILRLGITHCHIELISQRAVDLFQRNRMDFSYDRLVEQIDCRTEEWIKDDWTLDQTWLFLRKRAGRIQGVSLSLKDVHAGYGEHAVVKGINLELAAGEQLVLRGDNGSGKTTLLRTLLGLHPLSRGRIKLGDMTLGSPEWKKSRHITGFLPQQNKEAQFPISAGEVAASGMAALKLPREEALYRWEIALRQTGSFHLRDRLWDSLSGGEKQRMALARCLCQDARILLIDEPTSYLDREGKRSLLEALDTLVLDVTPSIILVSHDDTWLKELNWPSRELRQGVLC